MRPTLALSCAFLSLLLLACEEGTPTAPQGATLTISANPTQIGVDGTSDITIFAQRTNGQPVNPGTEIRLTTTLGDIDPLVTTDTRGTASAMLEADGRAGTADVTASSGPAETASVNVTIGFAVAQVNLQASPSSVDEDTGGTISLVAFVENDRGDPFENARVAFSSELGRLESGGSFLAADEDGEVRDTLRVSPVDIDGFNENSFTVTAEASATGSSATDSEEIIIRRDDT